MYGTLLGCGDISGGPVFLELRVQWCGQAVQQPHQCLSYLRTEISVVMGRNQMLQAGWSGKLLRGRALELIVGHTSRGSQAGCLKAR